MTDEAWRKKVDSQARPAWLQPYVSGAGGSCLIKGLF